MSDVIFLVLMLGIFIAGLLWLNYMRGDTW
jgi:hypothetical protein